jgi:hypothetical protein
MKFYAIPYNIEAEGFYFETFEELEDLSADWEDKRGMRVEEYSIEFIDGDSGDSELFEALKVNLNSIDGFIEFINEAHDDEKAAMFFLADNLGLSLQEAIGNIDEVMLFQGDAKEAGEDKCGGDFVEFRFAGRDWTCTNANSITF